MGAVRGGGFRIGAGRGKGATALRGARAVALLGLESLGVEGGDPRRQAAPACRPPAHRRRHAGLQWRGGAQGVVCVAERAGGRERLEAAERRLSAGQTERRRVGGHRHRGRTAPQFLAVECGDPRVQHVGRRVPGQLTPRGDGAGNFLRRNGLSNAAGHERLEARGGGTAVNGGGWKAPKGAEETRTAVGREGFFWRFCFRTPHQRLVACVREKKSIKKRRPAGPTRGSVVNTR
eukprot:scaffold29327_cov101-Isochrysis_galbana.AAC.4